MKKIFLTGATGVVGSSVLEKLIQQTTATVVLLVRGQNPKDRIKSVFQFLNLEFASYENRIQFINASAEDRDYNLNKQDLETLAESLGYIFHCAANVDLNQSAEMAKATALASIDNIIQILKLNPKCKLEHVSTVGVNGSLKSGLSEERISTDRPFFNSYEMSKAYVEEALYPLIDKGFAITIHRPSMVVGDESTGRIFHFQIFYFLLRVISGDITYGLLPPILDRRLDTIPSNFVADVLFRSSKTEAWVGKIIHHCSGPEHSLTLRHILNLVQTEKAKEAISYKSPKEISLIYFSALSNLGKTLPLSLKWKKRLELLPQLLNYAQQDQIFYNSQTKLLMADTIWPDPKTYLSHSISYYLQKRKTGGRGHG